LLYLHVPLPRPDPAAHAHTHTHTRHALVASGSTDILPVDKTPQTLSNFQSLTASIFGVCAGILGLESYAGFVAYLVLYTLTTLLFYALQVAPDSLAAGKAPLDTSRYFRSVVEFWASGLLGGLSGFILTWTLFYGLVRA
jgi:hypothetical protein